MSRFAARRQAPVGVAQAQAFVDCMRDIARYAELRDGWNGEGSIRVRVPAVLAARKLLEARQVIATRFTPIPLSGGGVALKYRAGVDGLGAPGHIHIDRHGQPAILDGDPTGLETLAPRFKSVSDKKFRKALDAIVSPRTGRIATNKVEVDGILFDSEIESKRYQMLKGEVRNGRVDDLRLQVPYPFFEDSKLCFTYYADFVYNEKGAEVVEDVKGMRTDVYSLKKKLIEARYGIKIAEWPVSRKELARREAASRRDAEKLEKAKRREERERIACNRRADKEKRAASRLARQAAKTAAPANTTV